MVTWSIVRQPGLWLSPLFNGVLGRRSKWLSRATSFLGVCLLGISPHSSMLQIAVPRGTTSIAPIVTNEVRDVNRHCFVEDCFRASKSTGLSTLRGVIGDLEIFGPRFWGAKGTKGVPSRTWFVSLETESDGPRPDRRKPDCAAHLDLRELFAHNVLVLTLSQREKGPEKQNARPPNSRHRAFTGLSRRFAILSKAPRQGAEQRANSSEKQAFCHHRGPKSGPNDSATAPATPDPVLAVLIHAWPALSVADQKAVLDIIRRALAKMADT